MKLTFNPSRRSFLISAGASGGALLVGCNRLPPEERVGAAGTLPAVPAYTALNAWVKIATDGTVTIPVPRAEMGQGITTALPMLVAEELGVPWSQVRFAEAPLDAVYRNALGQLAAKLAALDFLVRIL